MNKNDMERINTEREELKNLRLRTLEWKLLSTLENSLKLLTKRILKKEVRGLKKAVVGT